jgi:hypothetical protein
MAAAALVVLAATLAAALVTREQVEFRGWPSAPAPERPLTLGPPAESPSQSSKR